MTNRIARFAYTITLIVALSCGAFWIYCSIVGSHDIKRDQIVAIERAVKMPEGSQDIHNYIRYYTLRSNRSDVDGESDSNEIQGLYVHPSVLGMMGFPGIRIRKNQFMPMYYDGNCKVIYMIYDIKKRSIDISGCHISRAAP